MRSARIPIRPFTIACLAAILLSACQQQTAAPDARASNPAKYDRDREYCNAQVSEYMTTRRNVDDSRNEIFRGDRDRFGQGELPSQMNAYSDTRSSDRVMSDCMGARGWQQPTRSWWQKLGNGIAI